jgi:translation initiation factor 4E
MASVSSLPGPALQASRSAVQAALAEHPEAEAHTTSKDGKAGDEDGSLEPGEIQEVDMQAQAETIRTVFSDSKNFNVKVRLLTFLLPIFVQSAYLSFGP